MSYFRNLGHAVHNAGHYILHKFEKGLHNHVHGNDHHPEQPPDYNSLEFRRKQYEEKTRPCSLLTDTATAIKEKFKLHEHADLIEMFDNINKQCSDMQRSDMQRGNRIS